MVHAAWIGGGKARYRNRFVQTNGLKAEERAGRALYGGIMTPAFVDQGLLGSDPDPGWPAAGCRSASALTRVSIRAPARWSCSGTAKLAQVGDQASEFPRIDDRLTGQRHRYLTVGAVSGQHELARGEHDRLMRYDMVTGQAARWDTDASIGEVVFVPRTGATDELDGYYLTFARSVTDDRSWLHVWDAADFPRAAAGQGRDPGGGPQRAARQLVRASK